MKHLGDRITALVDGQLSHDERDRALSHVAVCAHCRAEVERERVTKAALLGMSEVKAPDDLVAQLLAVAEPEGPAPPDRAHFPGHSTPATPWRPEDGTVHRSWSAPDRRSGRLFGTSRVAVTRFAAGGVVACAALAAVLASLGGSDTTHPAPDRVVPPLNQFRVEHARSTGSLPFADPASLVVPVSEPAHSQAPGGYGSRGGLGLGG